jgi:hypothetical protein
MKLLLQTLGILGLTVILAAVASLVLRAVAFRQALGPACLLVAAVAFLAPFPDKVSSDVNTARDAYHAWAPVGDGQARAATAATYGIDAAFVGWFRAQLKPGEKYYWAFGGEPKGNPYTGFFKYHNHWITYQMLPFRAVDSLRDADVAMLYNVTRKRWRRLHPGPMKIQMYAPNLGIAWRQQ